MSKHKVIILGKIPPPYYGPALATEIILNSSLKEEFDLIHIDTRLNSSMKSMGKVRTKKLFLIIKIYKNYIKSLSQQGVGLVLIPIAQETSGLIKDSVFIILALIKSKKVLLHLRGSALLEWYKSRNLILRAFFKMLLLKSSGAIVLGNNLKYIFEPFLPPEKIFVIPNGANYSFPAKSGSETNKVFLYFGNLQAAKGIEDVLNATGLLSENYSDQFTLKVAGSWRDDKFEQKCKNLVAQNKLSVEFHPPMTGVSKMQLFADADSFVFTPNAPEGHPWVIIEAMAAGLPIISTDQGAITESVIDGINGFIVEPGNPVQISEKMEYLINHPGAREKMGKESRRLYEEKFTEEKMVENLRNAFYKVINN